MRRYPMRPLRVVIDARFVPGASGGVETMVTGLAEGFAAVPLDDVSLTFLTYAGHNEWIRPYLHDSLHVVETPVPSQSSRMFRKCRIWAVRPHGRSFGVLPGRDQTMDRLHPDIVHFPRQNGVHVDQPFIYHPHDLQHRHLPGFFTARQIAFREVVYGSLCRRAAAVAVGTSWVKQDLVQQMRIDPRKVFVVPLAPVTAADDHQPADLARFAIPHRYVLYPAASWPHKNHGRLFQALALLRRRGIEIPLVLTGPRPAGVDLKALATAAGVSDIVFDLGYLPQLEVEALTAAAVAMVVPTLFEAASFPVWEAFRLGTPVACSNVTSLPRQVGDAGLLFDPCKAEAIASAIASLWESPLYRDELADLGRTRVAEFSWDRTARQFVALYHHVGGRELSCVDRDLLGKAPLL
jgi:glycosyltransferase involved in cell wall biosynthesis